MTTSQVTADTSTATLAKAGYRVLRSLATDELGDIYLAERTDSVQLVALRVLRPELSADEDIAREVRRRSNLVAKVAKDHPNLAAVYECGETEDGRLFVATEHIDGENLAEIIRRTGSLDLGRCLRLAVQIAQGLEFIHNSAGSIHGDLRPENVVIAGDGETVKVRGFELSGARRAGRADSSHPTVPALLEYLAPEQIRGEAIAESTDIYTFGLLVYEMLDGTPPFTASTPDAVAVRQLNEAPLPLGTRGRKIPNSIDRLVLQTLEKAPDRRPQDMTEVANALWTELGRLDERIFKSKRRRPAWKAAGAGSLAILVAAAWVLISQKAHPPATVTPRSPAVMSAPAVIPPTEQDLRETHAAADGATEAAPVPTASPNAASVEPAAPKAVEGVPARSAAPEAKPERVGSRLTESRPSGGQRRREQGRPAGQDITNSDAWTGRGSMRAPAMSPGKERSSDRYESLPPENTDIDPPTLPRTPDAPDPSDVIDWLLRKSSAAR